MKKTIFFLAVLLAAALALSGCNLIATDPVLDAQQVIVQVGPDTVTKAEFNQQVDNQLNSMAQLYAMFGQSYDPTNAAVRREAEQSAAGALAENLVLLQKAKAQGLDVWTEEEEKAIAEEAQTSYDTTVSNYTAQVAAEQGLEGDALTAAVNEGLVAADYTLDKVIESLKKQKLQDKLRAQSVADVAVGEDEITAAYNTRIQEKKDAYAANLPQYGSDLSSGSAIYYVPAGYRYIKHVLIQIADEAKTRMTELQAKIDGNAAAKQDLQQQVDRAVPEGASAEDLESLAQNRADAQKQLDELNTQDAAAAAELEELKKTAFEAVLPDAQAVLQKAQLGLNFDSLVVNYGQDPGMQSEPAKTQGYALCEGMTTYEPAFQQAAMALAKPGDISDLVQTNYGYHILRYADDLAESAVDIATVHSTLQGELLTTKQDAAYEEVVAQWVKEAGVKTYLGRLH
ncbi:MAG: SurA N-terminal domain-containing protein [Oscillospiraceae bacterium]|jgi:peptidyl-prolyl cis-trans isomerase C|nr:SurA N-terminal domain-containing protein [Oscillospiraceae bacterium]